MNNSENDNSNTFEKENNNDSSEKEEIPIPLSTLVDNQVIISGPEATTTYENGFYGTLENEKLVLEAEEAILLLERKRIHVSSSEGVQLSPSDLVAHFSTQKPNFWAQYLVYKDLRNRGYVVRLGFGESAPYRLYHRGGKPGTDVSKTIVYPLPEGQDLELSKLDEITAGARRARKRLILAVVDRIGDVTFYSADQLKLERNQFTPVFLSENQTTLNEQNDLIIP
ncbi:MAG: tRNA-intron lyase [Promethearchaeota archaeon]